MTSKNIDREMILLQKTVDEADKKYSQKLTPKTHKIIKTVEDFISKNDLICYGGMAINNILPKKSQFYKTSEFPDYDFFSNDALSDAKKTESTKAGEAMRLLLEKDIKPSDIITRKSLENAVRLVTILGGSTNAVLHFLAIARAADIDFTLKDFLIFPERSI